MEIIYFAFAFLIIILELIVSGLWLRIYFSTGFPVFKKSIFLNAPIKLSSETLTKLFHNSWSTPILFKKFNENQIAFREQQFHISLMKTSYTFFVHGVINYDDINNEFRFVGYTSWASVLFYAIILVIMYKINSYDLGSFFLMAFLILFIFAVNSFIQFIYLKNVYKKITRSLNLVENIIS